MSYGKINLYEELIDALKRWNHTIEDIAWISISQHDKNHVWNHFEIPLDRFLEAAKNTWYGTYYEEVNSYPEISFKDGSWLEWVKDYDYDWEGWEYNCTSRRPDMILPDDVEIELVECDYEEWD